jgi:pilus assembly protein CpaB
MMDRRRLTIALSAALLLSGVVTFFLNRKINSRNVPAVQHAAQKYVAAIHSLQPGEVLSADNLSLIDWPMKPALEGGFAKVEDLVGRAAIYPIAAGQPILQAYLAAPGSGFGLTIKIADGMRAVSVRSDEIVGVAGFLFPGSHVDVLATLRGDAVPHPETQIVLQDVEVLTAGQKIQPDPAGKAETVGVVTLLLAPADAQKLVLASTQGTIHFVLRNGGDLGVVTSEPISIVQLSGEGRPNVIVSSRHEHVPAKQTYVVETILGDKRATSEFEN